MIYKLSIKGVDCNNCANKISEKINKLKEVEAFEFNFFMEEGILKTDSNYEEVIKKIMKITRKIETEAKVELLND